MSSAVVQQGCVTRGGFRCPLSHRQIRLCQTLRSFAVACVASAILTPLALRKSINRSQKKTIASSSLQSIGQSYLVGRHAHPHSSSEVIVSLRTLVLCMCRNSFNGANFGFRNGSCKAVCSSTDHNLLCAGESIQIARPIGE